MTCRCWSYSTTTICRFRPPVGALNRYLARLMSGRFYATAKKGVERVLSVAPPMLELARRIEEHAKGMVVPATMFEEFGFNYIGRSMATISIR